MSGSVERIVITGPADPRLQPRLRDLWQLWLELAGGRAMPRQDEITPFILRPWLGSVLLAERLAGDDFRYRLYGSNLVAAFGFDLTGKTASECIPLIGPMPLEEYRRTATTGKAEAIARGSPARRDWLKMDKVALPLCEIEGGPVTRILAAIYTSEPTG